MMTGGGNGFPMNSTMLRSKYVNDAVETMSPGRQIVALYDRLVLDLDRAIDAIAKRDLPAAHDGLVHAQAILAELHDSLDVGQWAGGQALRDLYGFVRTELVAANVDKDAARVQACREVVTPLRDAWREAAGIVSSGTSGAA